MKIMGISRYSNAPLLTHHQAARQPGIKMIFFKAEVNFATLQLRSILKKNK
jgi:hypothetical protein